ncbi:hypothetical protein ACHAXA_001131 [Cyclostephanos tholiformis]|uniref:GH16 domain-containing protein n=1 Tax=Cyclostephanos tholiformis TaxID=382380 RepID=A0ABD3R5C3_9STRA
MTTSNENSPLVSKDDGSHTQERHPPPLIPMGLGPETNHDDDMSAPEPTHRRTTTATTVEIFGCAVNDIVVFFVLPAMFYFAVVVRVAAYVIDVAWDGGTIPTGPYRLVEAHVGGDFFSHYDFYDGPDSVGSAGHNSYVPRSRAEELGIAGVVVDNGGDDGEEEFAYMSSAATHSGPRDSIRLEGRTRFDRGLFVLDVRHMPDGCGVWPAFWLTDEARWPMNGEVDVLEGVNGQTTAKTALHTSNQCDMYAHVAPYAKTGHWEMITGIPDHFTGDPDYQTVKGADNCWTMAPHQWENEGCTVVHERNDTIGAPVNANGGGLYVLEWDPVGRYHEGLKGGYIKSWVFSPSIPQNLRDALDTAGMEDSSKRVAPDPLSWGLPYAYFAIGETTGCSADHFKHMRIVFDLAFCGTVSGNRFTRECPALAKTFNVTNEHGDNDPVSTCNAYIESNPKALEQAYWKIKGVYVYERELEHQRNKFGQG